MNPASKPWLRGGKFNGQRSSEEQSPASQRIRSALRQAVEEIDEAMQSVQEEANQREEKEEMPTMTEPDPTMTQAQSPPPNDPFAAQAARAVEPFLKIDERVQAGMNEVLDTVAEEIGKIDEKVEAAVKNAPIASASPLTLTINIPPAPEITLEGRQHHTFSKLLKILAAGCNAWVVGPAGSGKTYAAAQAAKALGLSFHCQSVGMQTTKSDLLGFVDAHSNYVSTAFRRAFGDADDGNDGGLMCLDEIDAGNPNIITMLNSAADNGYCSFPDKMVRCGKSFRLMACANTWGTGATRQYIGRNPIDAATVNRFVFLEWPYDEQLEKSLCSEANQNWFQFVLIARSAVNELNVQHIISPRATIHGDKLLTASFTQAEVEEMVLWKGLDVSTKEKVKTHISNTLTTRMNELREKATAAGLSVAKTPPWKSLKK